MCSSFHQTSGSSEWNSEGPGEDFPLWDGCWNEWKSVGESKDCSADTDSGQSSGDMWEHDLSTETDTFQESGRRLPLEDIWNITFPRIHVVMTRSTWSTVFQCVKPLKMFKKNRAHNENHSVCISSFGDLTSDFGYWCVQPVCTQ